MLNDLAFIAKCKSINKNNVTSLARCSLSPSFICSTIYRLSHQLHKLKIPLLPKLLWWVNFLLFKVDLDHRAKLYGGIYMPHPMGIVIGDGVYSKGNVKFMQGCTLGGNLGRFEEVEGKIIRQPQIFSNSFIGINSQLLGPLVFKENIFVAPNSTITKAFGAGLLYGVNEQKPLCHVHIQELS